MQSAVTNTDQRSAQEKREDLLDMVTNLTDEQCERIILNLQQALAQLRRETFSPESQTV
jgi:hypothetical protein